jgi:zinc protease
MMAYKVGSGDEDLDHTGLSHYLEHLMFKGTDKIMPGDIDRLTLRNGGKNNAYTSEDYTIFHFDFAADRWEPALQVEADRMRNLRIDDKHEFQQEKGAVISELDENEDRPWDLETKAILPLLFDNGPYGHPVIGERDHVRKATAAVIKAHYDRWYHPNNAALVICGGFDPDRTMAKIKELFGPIPSAKLPERKPVAEVARKGPVTKTLESKFDVPRMLMGFNTVRIGEPDFYVLEVIQALLASGKTSRFHKQLVEEEEIATSADATNGAGRYPGWFAIQLEVPKDKSRQKAEELVLAELKRLADKPVSAAELKRVERGVLAGTIFGRESVHDLADSIAHGVTTNDLNYLKTYLPNIMKVTPADIQRVAKKYFDPQKRVVVWSIPKGADKETGRQGDKEPKKSEPRRQKAAPAKVEGAKHFSLTDAKRVVLPNGLTLLLMENHQLPIVVAEAYVRSVRLLEPADKAGLATLVGNLLEEGTLKHEGPEIAEMIENVGGSLSFNASGGTVKVLTPDWKLGLSVFFECLIEANFPKDPFNRERDSQLSQIGDSETKPEDRAEQAYRSLVYGKHPFGRPALGYRKTVEALTRKDCRAFHRKLFVPNNMIVVIVGDFDTKQVIDEVTRLTTDWKSAPVPKPTPPPVEKPEKFVEKIVSIPDSERLYFYLGQPGIRRDNPDYYKLLVMDHVLGTGPGFTDRLSSRLRDRKGLAYTVSANITSSAGEEPGLFTGYIATEPRHFDEVRHIFMEELERIRTKPPTAEEVKDIQKYLVGRLPFLFTTNEGIADQLLYVERYGLGFDYMDHYRKAIESVTPADVLEVARKYLDPKHMVLVAAGAVDAKGKPLARGK